MCRCCSPWRRQLCSWGGHWIWMGFRCLCGECLGWCMQTIELESVQIDAILKNGHLGHHDIRMCEMWARAEGTHLLLWQMHQEGVQANTITFMAVLNMCASIVAIKEGRYVHEQIIQSRWDSYVFLGRSSVDMYATCVGAQRMLGDCLRRCHLEWWLGMLWDWDMWNVGKGKTLWNYFDKCNRKGVWQDSMSLVFKMWLSFLEYQEVWSN